MTGPGSSWWRDSDAASTRRRETWAEADARAARQMEADELAGRVAGWASALRWWAGVAAGLVLAGLLIGWSLGAGG